MTPGEKLTRLRNKRTQAEVAKALNITQTALSMYENDARVPRDEIKVKLSNFYGVSVQELFFDF